MGESVDKYGICHFCQKIAGEITAIPRFYPEIVFSGFAIRLNSLKIGRNLAA